MAQQIISTGTGPNTGTGDPGFTAFTKVNANFTELYASLAGGNPVVIGPPTTVATALTVNNIAGADAIDINYTSGGITAALNIAGSFNGGMEGIAVANRTASATAVTQGLVIANDTFRTFNFGKTSSAFSGSFVPGTPAGEICFIEAGGNIPICFTIGPSSTQEVFRLTSSGSLFDVPQIAGPTLTLNGAGNFNPLLVNGSSTSGQSFGPQILAGTNSSDYSLLVSNQTNTATFLRVRGDGSGFVGPSASTAMAWNAAGNYTLGAPSSGVALTTTGVGGQQTANFVGALAVNNSFGLNIQAGTSGTDYALQVQNAAATATLFKLSGNGSGSLGQSGGGTLSWGSGGTNFVFNGASGGVSSPAYLVNGIQTGSSTFANSAAINTTDTYLSRAFSIPAGAMFPGSSFLITIVGGCTSTAANTATFTARLGAAGTTADTALHTGVFSTTAGAAGNGFVVRIYVTVQSVGAAGVVTAHYEAANTASVGLTSQPIVVLTDSSGTTINTTGALFLGVSFATSVNTTTCTFYSVNVLRTF